MGPNLKYLHANSNEHPKRNIRYATFACRLAKIAQTMQNKHATGNNATGIITMVMMLILRKKTAAYVSVWNDLCM